jgi:uncharacterized membrane protein
MYGPWWTMGHAGFGPGFFLFPLLWVVLIVLGFWLLFRSRRPWHEGSPNRARAILDERYAAGELSTEEYHERLKVLRTESRGSY